MSVFSTSLTLSNGMKMPTLGLGTWKSKPGEVQAAVAHAIKVNRLEIESGGGGV